MVRCLAFALAAFCVFSWLVNMAQAQAANATTDPSEARALNAIFSKWGISKDQTQWNISGELCSGRAIDTTTTIDHPTYNPFIKCDCSYNNKTTCHITALKVYAVDVVGEIPEELWSLTYLTNLNLAQNNLMSSLPAAIGNLTRMQYLNLGINPLSGELPKELGNLTNLIVLGLGAANLSGPFPSELGNLIKLEQLYFDSSGISGPIPSTFANLKNLVTVWASNVELTGGIPDFIGSWSKLQTLRFQGNSFEGPIPSSFSNLTSLTELRISDLSNGSSSLAFLRNMKSLTILELRNNKISGSIPSFIGEFQNLTQLDLSFNNVTGQIPGSIFNLSSLSYLFLGDNKLSGTLPTQKSSSLLNIDLSHNELSGNLPSWVNQPNLQLNLVANNLTIQSSSSSGLPTGLNCLQKNFPCNRGAGRYSDFAIKCGGPQITTTDGTVYEMDNGTLGPATYFVTDTNRWGVSNVGLFTGNSNPLSKSFVSNQFALTMNPELFQTARLSASSLRYYGLGLENGFYNITLQFAETAILDTTVTTTWRSLGRRVFDIYVQGTRVLKDFDIRKEAGGFSYRVVRKEFRVQVSENNLEIHLFWAGKGTCCIPAQGTYGPLIQAITATRDINPTVSNNPPSSKKNRAGLIAGIVVGVGVLCFLSVLAIFCMAASKLEKSETEDDIETHIDVLDLPVFDLPTIITATNNFLIKNKIGQGGFGPVYKGKLADGQEIAVKRLSRSSGQGITEFINEVKLIVKLQHRNLVRLLGCCIQAQERLLVYEYMDNGSLDSFIFDHNKGKLLKWPQRFHIIFGIAKGISYLHQDSRLRIIHRDLKASNVLLDDKLNPKISDFGMAKAFGGDQIEGNTNRVVGTYGYMAPEYAVDGLYSIKSDVFSFGILLLEIICGNKNRALCHGNQTLNLVGYAWTLWKEDKALELIDSNINDSCVVSEVLRCIHISLLCVQQYPEDRPTMTSVLQMLGSETGLIKPKEPGFFPRRVSDEVNLCSNQNEMSTNDELTITSLNGR